MSGVSRSGSLVDLLIISNFYIKQIFGKFREFIFNELFYLYKMNGECMGGKILPRKLRKFLFMF